MVPTPAQIHPFAKHMGRADPSFCTLPCRADGVSRSIPWQSIQQEKIHPLAESMKGADPSLGRAPGVGRSASFQQSGLAPGFGPITPGDGNPGPPHTDKERCLAAAREAHTRSRGPVSQQARACRQRVPKGSSSPSSRCRVGMAEPAPLGVGGSPGWPERLHLQRWSQHEAFKHLTRPRWFMSLAGLPTSWSVGTTSLAKRKRCPWSTEHPQQQRREGPSSTTAGLHRDPGLFQHPLSLLPAPPSNGVSSPAGGGTEAAAVGSGDGFPPAARRGRPQDARLSHDCFHDKPFGTLQ